MRSERKAAASAYKAGQRNRMMAWRQQKVIQRVERPAKLARARSLGYRAKQGFVIIRARVHKGGRHREKFNSGRRASKRGRIHYTAKLSMQSIAEQRVAGQYPNLEVLNSYKVGDDSMYAWYEIILVDPVHPAIISDPKINWIICQRGRTFRGLTSEGKKNRGLDHKGKGAEHLRPSVRVGKHK